MARVGDFMKKKIRTKNLLKNPEQQFFTYNIVWKFYIKKAGSTYIKIQDQKRLPARLSIH